MAQTTVVNVPALTWTQLTNGDVTTISFENLSEYDCYIAVTTDTTAPTDLTTAALYGPRRGEANLTLADVFDGTSGADRVWAYARDPIDVWVSHA